MWTILHFYAAFFGPFIYGFWVQHGYLQTFTLSFEYKPDNIQPCQYTSDFGDANNCDEVKPINRQGHIFIESTVGFWIICSIIYI